MFRISRVFPGRGRQAPWDGDGPRPRHHQDQAVGEDADEQADVAAGRTSEHEARAAVERGGRRPRSPSRRTGTARGVAVISAPKASASSPAIALPSSQSSVSPSRSPRGPEALGVDRGGGWPSSTSRSAARSTKAVGPQTKIARPLGGAGPDRGEQLGVDAAVEARPAGRRLARERPVDRERRVLAQARELLAVEDVVPARGPREQPRLDRAALGGAVAQHRHQRDEPRAAGDQQQRPAVRDAPGEVPADRAAQLELVAGGAARRRGRARPRRRRCARP